MHYHEAANFLFDLRRFAPRPGTDATRELLAALDDPHESISAVQIAGSNGKGSTARMLEAVLREAGLDVGLYTSPHLDDVRERVRVNGRKIPKAALVEFIEEVEPYATDRAAAGDSPTFFETLTALACWEFDRQNVDVAILEVGIGGRYDATSVVDPIASAVTSVTLEHTDLLGDTVDEIARDKAAVAPTDAPLVTAATGDALAAIHDEVEDVIRIGSPDEDADLTVEHGGRDGIESPITLSGQEWHVETRLPLLGEHQARNAGVAAALARQVADVADETLATGLRRAHWPGRFEVLDREPLVVLDGAHNPGGCERVAETLDTFEYDELYLVVGAMCDKDHHGIADALPAPDHVTATHPDVDRAEDEQVVAHAFESETEADVRTRSDVAGALADTLDAAGPDDAVLVSGSLYAVREARTRWTRPNVPKRVESIPDAEAVLEGAHVTEAGTWRMRGKGVHRVLKTRVQPRQAQYLKEELLSLGGECAVSGLGDQDREHVDAVMMGTLAQFKRLAGKLDGQPYGLSPFADEIRESLEIGVAPDERGYPWEDGTAVMGILNVTPDSFHDGGEHNAVDEAIERAEEMIAAGVDIVDVGGESTRPGADPVPVEEERDRVVPVIERLASEDMTISIDTRKVDVAEAALAAGADILNDVTGLDDPAMAHLAAEHDVPIVVMHSIDTPVDPDHEVHYDDVVEDVIEELTERVLLAEKAGLDRSQILVDPGLGFGKTDAENFEVLDRLGEFEALGCPLLVGHSHKSMFEMIDRGPDERYEPTVAATALAAERGADVIRVHDVAANVAAVDIVEAADDPGSFED
ncbi:dihydropteroate synthase [Halorhabdus sp. BNX81]|uniref:dihydropteroate synthase n=1 Tax=Halorhabdus sp. BNX81 TaxID=2980181 RepID=UPI0023DCF66B|nr:dihydropteroate synthase [Halorhabdus sp. BNX81]WEL21051.1 Dihydrofolate synthase / dihydropteroate synthase [Halorhabdus sp. BNX81]